MSLSESIAQVLAIGWRRSSRWLLLPLLACLTVEIQSAAQDLHALRTRHVINIPHTQALLISDIHLDPFQDPSKVQRLSASSIKRWSKIFNEVPSRNQPAAFEQVREKCGREVFDTSPKLFQSTLGGVRARRHAISFGVLTGDLVAHDFLCRYEATMPGRSHADAQAFLAKTIKYVVTALSLASGSKPLYVALGTTIATVETTGSTAATIFSTIYWRR